jgi:hypothetical protein
MIVFHAISAYIRGIGVELCERRSLHANLWSSRHRGNGGDAPAYLMVGLLHTTIRQQAVRECLLMLHRILPYIMACD